MSRFLASVRKRATRQLLGQGGDAVCSFLNHFFELRTKSRKELEKKQIIHQRRWPFVAEDDVSTNLDPTLLMHWKDLLILESDRSRFLTLFSGYKDVLHHNQRTHEDFSVIDAYVMHALNHILKSQEVISDNDDHPELVKSLKDRGFTRTKVLIIAPLQRIARRILKRLSDLTPDSHKVVENLYQLKIDSSDSISEESEESDIQCLFDKGSINDQFLVGITIIGVDKIICNDADINQSDLIIASPAYLNAKINEAEVLDDMDVDYLSSIEVVVIDHADLISMNNWNHVCNVFAKLNHMPKKRNGSDITRIKECYLNDLSKYYRQTIILGFYNTPGIQLLFRNKCFNFEGKMMLDYEFHGVLSEISSTANQLYERFMIRNSHVDSLSVGMQKERCDYFERTILPDIMDCDEGGVLIFMSEYFESQWMHKLLDERSSQFTNIKALESSTISSQQPCLKDDIKIMLCTEVDIFSLRHRIKVGQIRKLIFFSLPFRKEIYVELVNMVSEYGSVVRVLHTWHDEMKLLRIVGEDFTRRMLRSTADVTVVKCIANGVILEEEDKACVLRTYLNT